MYHVFDASKIPMGTMCTKISVFVRGKHKPIYSRKRAD